MSQQEKTLKLTVADLCPAYKAKPPLDPRFYHFMDTKTAKDFHEATLIIYTRPDGSEYVIKDSFGRRK